MKISEMDLTAHVFLSSTYVLKAFIAKRTLRSTRGSFWLLLRLWTVSFLGFFSPTYWNWEVAGLDHAKTEAIRLSRVGQWPEDMLELEVLGNVFLDKVWCN